MTVFSKVLLASALAAVLAGCGEAPVEPYRGIGTVTDAAINRAVSERFGDRLRALGVTRIAAKPSLRNWADEAGWFEESCQDISEADDDDCYRLDFHADFGSRAAYAYRDDELPSWSIASPAEVAAAVAAATTTPQEQPPVDEIRPHEWQVVTISVDASGAQVRFPAEWKSTKSHEKAQHAVFNVVDVLLKPLEREASWGESEAPAVVEQDAPKT